MLASPVSTTRKQKGFPLQENLLIVLTGIIALGVFAQWLSWWLKQPAILGLLVIGIIAGPVTGVVNPDQMFGDLLFPMVSLGVALVLFEGALTLRFKEIRGHGPVVTALVTWGAVVSWVLISAGCWLFTSLDWKLSLLFGALVVVTGPTVIVPLLRSVRPTMRVGNILRWEGIIIDPLGAMFAVLVYEFIVSGTQRDSILAFLQVFGVGLGFGVVAAFLLLELLKRHLIPEFLINPVVLGVVLAVFSGSNHFAHESGLLAVTVMGFYMGNNKKVDISDILTFKENLSVLIISVMFIVLAARLDPNQIWQTGFGAVGVLLTVMLARPIVVWLSSIRSGLSINEKMLLSWIAPRGIVAAAVSALFALKLEALGYPEAQMLTGLAFLVIIFTVLLQSLTASTVAKWLGVQEEEPRGVLIIGSNPFSRALAKSLISQGFRVKLTGTSWAEIQSARMDGLDTYFGNPVSAHADSRLDLIGFGRLFAMSRRPAFNTLACVKYRHEFGKTRVFTLRNATENDESNASRVADKYHAPRLFGGDITAQKLESLIARGAELKTTRITENFSFDDYRDRYNGQMIMLYAVGPSGNLRVWTDTDEPM